MNYVALYAHITLHDALQLSEGFNFEKRLIYKCLEVNFLQFWWKLKGLALLVTATTLQSLPGTSGGRLLRALNPSISKKAKTKNFTFQKLP